MSDISLATILVIDDNAAGRYAIAHVLKNAGYTVLEAASCQQAREQLLNMPALVILDVQLPDGNGFEFCKALKAASQTSNISILMTSASFVEAVYRAQGLDSGADGYLTTPIDSLELLATVRALLRVRDMEDKLRKSQEIFCTMADSVPALVWMADTQKQCYYFNRAWTDFTGRALEQDKGDGWLEGVHSQDIERYREQYNHSFDSRKSFETTCRLKRHDGEYRWVLSRWEPHYNINHEFVGYTGAGIDVHDKLISERKLQESEKRLELAMQGMNDGLWDWNVAENNVYFSPRYKSMLGYNDEELPSSIESAIFYIHPEDQAGARERITQAIEGKTATYKNIFRMCHKDGTWRWIMSRGVPIKDVRGNVIRMTGAHTDITELKELERALREAYEKAETANNAKTEFLTNMSHEIRTPMNAIIGLSNILATTPLSERQKEFITTLQLSAESLLTLINDMLDIAKIEDNMIELEQTPFSLSGLIDQIMSMMSVKANEKKLQLDVVYEGEVHDMVIGDPLRVQQIIVNLLNNAIKFTAKGGVKIRISEAPDNEKNMLKTVIRIVDTGIGIPKDKHYSIFEKFTQADSSVTRKYGGSGLGLTITRALLERMGGHIHLASEVGQGSTFTITIPFAVTQKANDNRNMATIDFLVEAEPVAYAQKSILLIEDYPPNILVATTLLEEFGYDYEVATNGMDALEKIKSRPFDAILMDIQMQGLDGYETTRRIREWEKSNKLSPLFIIAMTAHALSGDRERCIDAGMNDYISKPFNPSELRLKLSHCHVEMAA